MQEGRRPRGTPPRGGLAGAIAGLESAAVQSRHLSSVIRSEAILLAGERLRSSGFEVEAPPPGLNADFKIGRRRTALLVKVLAAAAPHHRGGSGSLGLHWLLGETAADAIALVDLSRSKVWLLPIEDFQSRALSLTRGRYHLDWIVVLLGNRTPKPPDEDEFACYLLE
jgi:hypothetical protein